jgi:hypothetical protein
MLSCGGLWKRFVLQMKPDIAKPLCVPLCYKEFLQQENPGSWWDKMLLNKNKSHKTEVKKVLSKHLVPLQDLYQQ